MDMGLDDRRNLTAERPRRHRVELARSPLTGAIA
jgi:hypothetical protein